MIENAPTAASRLRLTRESRWQPGKQVLLLNNDVVVTTGWLGRMLRRFAVIQTWGWSGRVRIM